MPCHAAIVSDYVQAAGSDTVENVLARLKGGNLRDAVVLDDDGQFLGVFSLKVLLKNLIPVSVAMANGVQIDVNVQAAPGVAKRLRNVKLHPVSEVVDRKPPRVAPDAPIWEGVNMLTRHGGPLAVVDDKQKFHGFVTYASLLDHLDSMLPSDG